MRSIVVEGAKGRWRIAPRQAFSTSAARAPSVSSRR
jgi:hypothetical protein